MQYIEGGFFSDFQTVPGSYNIFTVKQYIHN